MLKNYLKTAWRNLARNKAFTLINVPGMALALASVMMLLLFIHHELTYDRFYEHSDSIARLVTQYESGGKEVEMPKSIYKVDRQITEKVPEVEASTVIFRRHFRYIGYDKEKYGRYQQSYTDEDFFEVFSLDMIKGDPGLLAEPHTAVLTRKTADEIFGRKDPINQSLTINEEDYRVVAVAEDVPVKSHLQFEALLSIHSLGEKSLMSYGHDFNTYFLLDRPLTGSLENKICGATQEIDRERYSQSSVEYQHYLQPLRRIHLHSDFSSDLAVTTDIQYIYIYSAIAFFILLIAAFNFINLSLARSETRIREVGVRKVHGASPATLRKQFAGESLLLAMGSFLLAILLVELFASDFSRLVDSRLHLSFDQNHWWVAGGLLLSMVVGLLAGAYPAFYLSRLGSAIVLKGSVNQGKQKFGLQKVLVAFQFFIAIALMASMVGIWNQVDYLKNKDLGFEKDQVLVARYLTSDIKEKYPSLRQELLKDPNIKDVTGSLAVPGTKGSGTNLRGARQQDKAAFSVRANLIQPGFVKLYEIPLVKGRGFSRELQTDREGFVINQKTADLLGMEDPVGQEIYIWGDTGRVLGVCANYHNRSLHREIDPVVLGHIGQHPQLNNYISVKISHAHTNQTVNYVGEVLKSYDPAYTYQYSFLDDYLQRRYYRKEEKYARLMMAGTLMAMLISIMGLFALTAFHINRKVKEIGIRKVMGASSARIVRMFAGRYLLWVGFSALLAFPLAYYFIQNWYTNFTYHGTIQWWFFAFALMVSLIVALLTVLGKALMAANTNPAETLRDE